MPRIEVQVSFSFPVIIGISILARGVRSPSLSVPPSRGDGRSIGFSFLKAVLSGHQNEFFLSLTKEDEACRR